MVVIVGLIVVLILVTCALTTLTDRAGTHDSFAVLSQRVSGNALHSRGRRNGAAMAYRFSARRVAPAPLAPEDAN